MSIKRDFFLSIVRTSKNMLNPVKVDLHYFMYLNSNGFLKAKFKSIHI